MTPLDRAEAAGSSGVPILQIEVSLDTTRGTAVVSGDLDLASAPRLGVALDRLLQSGYHDIVLDVSELNFLDAAGLGVLVCADDEFRAAGGRLVLSRPTARTRRILAITGLDTKLTVRG